MPSASIVVVDARSMVSSSFVYVSSFFFFFPFSKKGKEKIKDSVFFLGVEKGFWRGVEEGGAKKMFVCW